MRLIDADELTDRLLNELRKIPGLFDKINGRQAANLIGKRIDEALTVGEWVSVDASAPENDTKVLVFTRWKDQAVWEYDSNLREDRCWIGDDDIFYGPKDVKYWMPLPEPPKEDT